MIYAPLLLSLLPLNLAAPQDAAADAARLVPPGSFLTLRVESAESLHRLAARMASLGGDGVPPDASAMLASMGLPGDSSQIDVKRPAYVALALGGMTTLPTFVVPVADAAGFAASLADDPSLHTAVVGGYVGISQQPGYAPSAQPNPAVAALRPGMASARLDLKTLIQTFRPMIEMGMSQLELMMDQAAIEMEEDAPMDMAALLEVYVEGIWAFLDSADQLDLALAYDGKSAQMRSWLSTLPGSPMAAMGGEEKFDLRPAARWIDPQAGFSMVMACDMVKTMERFAPIMDLVFDAYPPDFAAEMRRFMDAYAPIWPLLGNTITATGDLGPGGLRASYQMLCHDPAALSTAMTEQLAKLAAGEAASKSFGVSAPQPAEIAGKPAVRARLDVDFRSLTEGMLEDGEVPEAQLDQMHSMMDAIYGPDGMQMVWQPLADRLAMALGGDDAFAAATLGAQPRDSARFPTELRDAIEAASGGSMGLVYRIDYGRLVSDMAPMFAGMGIPDLEQFAELDLRLPITFWMRVGTSTWSSGIGLDLDQLAAVVAAMQQVEAADEHDHEHDDGHDD